MVVFLVFNFSSKIPWLGFIPIFASVHPFSLLRSEASQAHRSVHLRSPPRKTPGSLGERCDTGGEWGSVWWGEVCFPGEVVSWELASPGAAAWKMTSGETHSREGIGIPVCFCLIEESPPPTPPPSLCFIPRVSSQLLHPCSSLSMQGERKGGPRMAGPSLGPAGPCCWETWGRMTLSFAASLSPRQDVRSQLAHSQV